MSKEEVIVKLIEVIETDMDINESTVLEDIEEWDSLAKLSLMAVAKTDFGKKLTSEQIRSFVTVDDICNALL